MRPINVSLDSVTWELAKKKKNFSEWVRNQLRSERNKLEARPENYNQYKCNVCNGLTLWHVEEKYPFCRATRGCKGFGENLVQVVNDME